MYVCMAVLALEPMSPALAGGFLTTAPPGKSPDHFLKCTVPCLCPKNDVYMLIILDLMYIKLSILMKITYLVSFYIGSIKN